MSGKYSVLSIEEQEALAHIDGLAESMQDIGAKYGMPLVLKLVQEYGGTRLFVPMKLPDDHELIYRLGEDNARKLFALCRGDRIDVPRSLISKQCRDEMVIRMAADNARQSDMARACNCTDRTIRNVLKKNGLTGPKQDTRQIDMFSKSDD